MLPAPSVPFEGAVPIAPVVSVVLGKVAVERRVVSFIASVISGIRPFTVVLTEEEVLPEPLFLPPQAKAITEIAKIKNKASIFFMLFSYRL